MASSARIDELRKKFEENPRRYFAPLANEYRKAGQIDQAIAICREYLPQQPGHMSGHIVYGQALYEARQFEEGKTVFETALALDPENLIALRHLGDIALITGDTEGARGWYRRVLDADPRNEEIQAQLLSLDQVASPPAAGAPTDPSSSAPTVVVEARGASAKTVETTPAVAPAADALPKTVELDLTPAPAPEIEKSGTLPDAMPTSVAPAADAPTVPFTLPGLETTSLGAPPSEASEPSPPRPADTDASAPTQTSEPSRAEEPTPAETPAPRVSLLDLSIPDVAASPPAARETPVQTPRVSGAHGSAADSPAPPVERPSTAPALDAGPFVTETMAELYLKQGHRDEALRVYRALLEQRPGDATLQERVAALEAEQRQMPAALPTQNAPERPGDGDAPTMRDVLAAIAERRPGVRPPMPKRNGATRRMSGETRAAAATPASAAPSRRREDALATILAAPAIGADDERAAQALAQAFSDGNGGNAAGAASAEGAGRISGAPARPAATELSLDAVFGGSETARPPSNVSYDQFFAQGGGAAGGSAGASSDRDASDDVAHFTQWLEGLKRR